MAAITGTLTHRIGAALLALASLTAVGCHEKATADLIPAAIGGKKFMLEIAAEEPKRNLGLGKRTSIADDGGMVFIFPVAEVQSFVMRDCPIPIDILFLDAAGRVLSAYTMTPEAPRGPDEGPESQESEKKYNDRLKRYNSRHPSQIVVELKGGRINELAVKEGDLVKMDIPFLKKLAK